MEIPELFTEQSQPREPDPPLNQDRGPDPLLDDLTDPQVEAVTHVDGPLLVVAGPGSGKTRTITRRIAYLVRRVGIAPWHVLAITFTNKAAGEMRERVAELLTPRQARALTVCTFHSLCARLCRMYADRLGLTANYSIYDTADQQRAVKQALEALDMSTGNFPPSKVLAAISNAKNELLGPEAFAGLSHDFYSKKIAQVYKKYEAILQKNNAQDFDDLLLNCVSLLKNHPDVLDELRARFQYLMIDEYQDTNHAQFTLANALASEHKNLCVTGDPDQSIYGWRGANIKNILEFETHYPNANTVRLEQNYRSTKTILAAADALISNNAQRKNKSLWTDNEIGDPVRVVTCRDEQHEARWLVDHLRDLHVQQGIAWSGMAIFYRVNSLSRVIEDALRTAAIPYQIARGTAFYDRKEIKDAIAFLRAIANPTDEVALLRIINTPARGISAASVKTMRAHAVAHQMTLNQILERPEQVTALNNRAVNSIARFGKLMRGWCDTIASGDGEEITLRYFVEQVLRESGLEDYYRNDKSDADDDRILNLGELISGVQQFETELAEMELELDEAGAIEDDLEIEQDNEARESIDADNDSASEAILDDPTNPFDPITDGISGDLTRLDVRLSLFLERVALISDADAVDDDQGTVTLMTLHAAKGLEFPVVAMLAVEEGLLPHERARDDPSEKEEERRLCFVGMTRARRHLLMTNARYRTIFGQKTPAMGSSFLRELPHDAIEAIDETEEHSTGGWGQSGRGDYGADEDMGDDDPYADEAEQEARQFAPGTLVRHPDFGMGRVVSLGRVGMHTRARVEFPTSGVKTLILQYARLEKVHHQ